MSAESRPTISEAEAAVLSAIFLQPESFDEVAEILKPEHFYSDANRRIFGAIVELQRAGKAVDITIVASYLHDKNRLPQIGGTAYLAQLTDATPAIANVAEHARLIREKWQLRQAIGICQTVAAEGYGDCGEIRAYIERTAQKLAEVAANGEPGSADALKLIGANEIFAETEPLNFVVESLDLAPGAPFLLAGYGYSGKTASAQQMEIDVAIGRSVWGRFPCRQGRVLHLDYEQGSRLTKQRGRRMALALDLTPDDLRDRLSYVSMPDLYLDSPDVEGILVRAFDGYTLAVVDSLRASAPSIEENDSSVRRILDMLNRVSERTQCTCGIILHARKPSPTQTGGSKCSFRGSGALFDAASSVLILEGAEKGQPITVHHEKARNTGILADDFVLRIEDVDLHAGPDAVERNGGLRVVAESAEVAALAAEQRKHDSSDRKFEQVKAGLLQLLEKGPQSDVEEMARRLRKDVKLVRGALKSCVADGTVLAEGSTRDRRYVLSGRVES